MIQIIRAINRLAIALVTCSATSLAVAGPVTTPNTFSSGSPAVAAEVNDNFSAIEAAVNDNDARIADLVGRIDALTAENQQLTSDLADATEFIDDLRAVLSLQDDNQGNPAVVFSGVNVQINNGKGTTDSINGLGNLIIGYDEPTQSAVEVCSDGQFGLRADCLAAKESFSTIHKSGSHNLVVGPEHNYSRSGGLVAGLRSTVNGDFSSVTGGQSNTASGSRSSVGGGQLNTASGVLSSVPGGRDNNASGNLSSVNGGTSNTASGAASSVGGGTGNLASGAQSNVGGGQANAATGGASTVSGGRAREADGDFDWVAGSLKEEQ